MNQSITYLTYAVTERKCQLINKLWIMGYTRDRMGKKVEDMTLTELEQIYINLKCQRV